jgi:uncharacterized protein YbaP (TraB family)
MKKRILALLLALIMCLTMVPTANVLAAGQTKVEAQEVTADTQTGVTVQNYSDWAFNELVIGDTYGIYPMTWYYKDMKVAITQGQLRVLMAGLRTKMVNTNCITNTNTTTYSLTKYLTVKEVLEAFYKLISGYEYTVDLGLKDKSASNFMKENGIFTGKNGELAMSDTCTIEQACVFATRLVTTVYDKLDAASKGFFWVAKSGENTVYMLGSVHIASNDIYPFSEEMLKAYQSSDALAVELNIYDQAGAMKVAELGMYTDGTTLRDHLTDEVYKKTVEFGTMMGVPEEQLIMFKPWYLYNSFSALSSTTTGNAEELAQGAALGIDYNFITNAIIYGKPILEIEGYESQGKMLDSFSDELEEYLLSATIDSVKEVISGTEDVGSEDLEDILELWRTGDADAFKKYTSMEYEYAELYKQDTTEKEIALIKEYQNKLMTQRDKGMADYIDTLLKAEGSSTYFVIVGSAHYISDYSVLDILKEKGYEINQIK